MSQKDKTQILLSGVNENVRNVLINVGIEKLLGAENIYPNINEALDRANVLLSKK